MTPDQLQFVTEKLDAGMERGTLRTLLLSYEYSETLIDKLFAAYDARHPDVTPPSPISNSELITYGQMIRMGIRVVRNNLGLIGAMLVALFAFVPVVVMGLIAVGLLVVAGEETMRSGLTALGFVLGFVLYVLVILYFMMVNTGLLRALARRREHNGFWKSFWWSWGRILTVFLVAIYTQMLVSLGITALVLPGIAVALYLSMAQFILVFEERRGFDVLTRSFELVYGRWWSVLGRLLVPVLLLSGAGMAFFVLILVTSFIAPILAVLFALLIVPLWILGVYWLVGCSVVLFESLQKLTPPTRFDEYSRKEITKWLRILVLFTIAVSLISALLSVNDLVTEFDDGFPSGIEEAPPLEEFQRSLERSVESTSDSEVNFEAGYQYDVDEWDGVEQPSLPAN